LTIGRKDSFLDLLVRQESIVAELYRVFSDHHPDHKEFWLSLEADELRHASMIRELEAYLSSRQALLAEGKVRAEAVKAFLSYVEGLLLRIRTEGIPFVKALSLSMDIEKSLVEKGMLDHFRGASAEMNGGLERLRAETATHAGVMEEMWNEKRPGGRPS
jgi:hypothetical protein